MQTYYLFIIKQEMSKLYKKNSDILFLILKNLYHLNQRDFVYGISVYHQICIPINTRLLSNYMIDKIPSLKTKENTFKILSFFENTTVKINHTNIIVKTDKKRPSIYQIFHIYHDNFFVCDFNSNEYFWLDKI